ncbi:MAG: hypothetical protein SGJ27_11485 [Candidatus Melainabacteria bacterium]|nr:hypothetical protein [Candidatus Melainabacteria bacterium]
MARIQTGVGAWYYIWCLVSSALVASTTQANAANELAIGPKARVSSVDITIVPPEDFNFKTRMQLSLLRYKAAMRYPQLLCKQYVPDSATFGQIADKKPWWGVIGLAYYGAGNNSIKGVSVQSMDFLNPYLLVSDNTVGPLPKDKVSEQDLWSTKLPMQMQATNLKWYPQAKRAEVTYERSQYEQEMSTKFNFTRFKLRGQTSLTMTNARDLGFNYVYIPASWASNVKIGSAMKTAMPIPHFIHCGGGCGYPGGCNNVSPATDWTDRFEIEKLPAKIGFSFWIDAPKTGREPPDMTFIVNYR